MSIIQQTGRRRSRRPGLFSNIKSKRGANACLTKLNLFFYAIINELIHLDISIRMCFWIFTKKRNRKRGEAWHVFLSISKKKNKWITLFQFDKSLNFLDTKYKAFI